MPCEDAKKPQLYPTNCVVGGPIPPPLTESKIVLAFQRNL